MRVAVKKAGKRSGSVLVVGADGKIKAKPGKLLKFVKLNLEPDSDLLKTANGYSMLECGYAELLTDAREKMRNKNQKCRLASNTISYGPKYEEARLLEFVDDGTVQQRIIFSKATKLPVEWTIFHNGQLFSTAAWRNGKQNTGMADSVFSISSKENTQ